MKLPPGWLGVKLPRLILAGGQESLNSWQMHPGNKNAEVVYIHALDYDLYLKEKDAPVDGGGPIAVFLDEFLPFHPDYAIVGIKPFMQADKYYFLLNDFFNLVEDKTGLQVVIADHPRAKYEEMPDYYNGRKRVKGKTIELVKQCRLVLAHCSTAVNFANLFYKPVLFMTSTELDKIDEGDQIREMSTWFGKKTVFMDRPDNVDFETEFKINREHYDNYRRSFIKADGTEELPFWQVVANRLKKGF